MAAKLDFTQETLIDKLQKKLFAELEQALITKVNPTSVYDLACKY